MIKLNKDFYSREELLVAEHNIKKNILNFIQSNELIPYYRTHTKSMITLTHKSIAMNSEWFKPFAYPSDKNFINDYKLFSSKDGSPSMKVSLHHSNNIDCASYYKYLYNNSASLTEKKVLIKTIFHDLVSGSYRNHISNILNSITEDDYWLHLRNYIPFGTFTKSLDNVREVLNTLSNKSIDNDEKVKSLSYFCKYYKQILKRDDIKSVITKVLKNNCSHEYIDYFESFLNINLKENLDINKIFEPNHDLCYFSLSKAEIFKQISFSNVSSPKVDDYNRYLYTINTFLTSQEASILNIASCYMVDFSSQKTPAKIYIQSNELGFSNDIKEVYTHLLISCTQFLVNGWKQETLTEKLKTSLDYYLLNKEISTKKSEETTLKIKNKI